MQTYAMPFTLSDLDMRNFKFLIRNTGPVIGKQHKRRV